MTSITLFSLFLFLCSAAHQADSVLGFTRSDFPRDFIFGAATSAYQQVPSSSPSDPEGLQFVLQYLSEAYGDLPIYVQENGNVSNDTIDDTDRVEYLKTYMGSTLKALRNGANVKGYFVWAFLDVFEFFGGYQSRYGLYRVDFEDEALPRQARLSAGWYSDFLKNNGTYIQNELDNTGPHAQQ